MGTVLLLWGIDSEYKIRSLPGDSRDDGRFMAGLVLSRRVFPEAFGPESEPRASALLASDLIDIERRELR